MATLPAKTMSMCLPARMPACMRYHSVPVHWPAGMHCLAGPPLMDEAGLGSSALEMTPPPVLTRLSLGHPASSDAAHTPFAERAKSISAPTTPLSRFRGPDLNQQPSPVEEGAEALRHGSGEMTDSEFTFVPHDTPHDTPTNVQEQQVPAEDS